MKPRLQVVSFGGGFLRRGFWLYVWEITAPDSKRLYYVGRTGDSSSQNAQSPFNRMNQHLGFNKRSNVLRQQLTKLRINPEVCKFKLLAYGPIRQEASDINTHRRNRDHIAAMEKALAEAMVAAGYKVMNLVICRMQLDEKAFGIVRSAFGKHFARLGKHRPVISQTDSRATV